MSTKQAGKLQARDVFDFTPWCEAGTTATAVVDKIRFVEVNRVSITATMLAVDGSTQDRWGFAWSDSRTLMILDADQEIFVL